MLEEFRVLLTNGQVEDLCTLLGIAPPPHITHWISDNREVIQDHLRREVLTITHQLLQARVDELPTYRKPERVGVAEVPNDDLPI
jgi:hypothetical protein